MRAPGIHQNVPMAEYLALDAVSASLLHEFRRTPLHARAYMLGPRKDTKALILGEAIHYAILEPERFGQRYPVPPACERRSKADKTVWEDWEHRNPQAVPLKAEERETVQAVAGSVRDHVEASRYLYGSGRTELTLVWDDDGLRCKARLDRLAAVDGWSVIADVKTTEDASPRAFSRDVVDYGYHNKAAWYLDACERLAPIGGRRFVFVVVEKKAPHAIALYELTDEAISQGRDENRAALSKYRECMATGVWPGFPSGVQYIDLPKWAQTIGA